MWIAKSFGAFLKTRFSFFCIWKLKKMNFLESDLFQICQIVFTYLFYYIYVYSLNFASKLTFGETHNL